MLVYRTTNNNISESDVPQEILHKKMVVRKSLNEVILSKMFVKSIFEKLNIDKVIQRFDDDKVYRTLQGSSVERIFYFSAFWSRRNDDNDAIRELPGIRRPNGVELCKRARR